MGLAEPIGLNAWRLHNDMEQVLKAMQRTADRQRTLAAHGALLSDERLPVQVLDLRTSGTVEGRILVHGQEEQSGKNYLMLEGTDARVHFIYNASEIEEARSRGELRANSFVRLRKVADPMRIEVSDFGDAEKLLTDRKHIEKTAKECLQRGTVPTEDCWGGWLGRYQAAIRYASVEPQFKPGPEVLRTHRRQERSSGRGR